MYIPVWLIVIFAFWWAWYCYWEQRDFKRMLRDHKPQEDHESNADYERRGDAALTAHELKYKHLY